MKTASRRHSFRFSLRALFAGFTALAIALGWLGNQIHWIAERQQELETANVWGGGIRSGDELRLPRSPKRAHFHLQFISRDPWWLRMFGQRAFWTVWAGAPGLLHRNVSSEEHLL
jgi:hypothetical protein